MTDTSDTLPDMLVSKLRDRVARWAATGGHVRVTVPLAELQAALTVIDTRPTQTGDWVMVPREPTEAMIEAHEEAHARAKNVFASVPDVWRAMISAAHEGVDWVGVHYTAEDIAPAGSEGRSATPPGMKPWRGGDSAPEDWDGGPTLFRDGRLGWTNLHSSDPNSACWRHDNDPSDIVAYTPQPSIPAVRVDRKAVRSHALEMIRKALRRRQLAEGRFISPDLAEKDRAEAARLEALADAILALLTASPREKMLENNDLEGDE